MRQEFANQLAIVITAAILVLAVVFAVYQSSSQGAPAADADRSPLVRPASPITHPLIGYEDCQACHAFGSSAAFPPDHAGWPNAYCAACHAPTVLGE
jgi:hypothetical protein